MKPDKEHMQSVLEAALRYANRGWPVLPIHAIVDGKCSCGDANCKSPGKHPANENGVNGVSTDEAEIRQWFDGSRQLNFGVACGERSGLFALDFDAPEGAQWFRSLSGESLNSFPTLKAQTGKKGDDWRGWHLFFKWTPEMAQLKNAAKDIPGVDWRNTGGYVVAAPSLHRSGVNYEWAGDGEEAEVTEMPAELLAALLATIVEKPKPAATRAGGQSIPEGCRNDRLYRIGCGMRGRGCEQDQILSELRYINLSRCLPPLEDREVTGITESVLSHPKGTSTLEAVGSEQVGKTDLWMARQLIAEWQGLIHFCAESKQWMVWSDADGVWREDKLGLVNQYFREMVAGLLRQLCANQTMDGDAKAKAVKKLSSFHNHRNEQAALAMATKEPGVSVSILEFDAKPDLLACGNCTIDLLTGQARKNDPRDRLTKRTGATYDPGAQAPNFMRFIAETFSDSEIGRYVQMALGSTLSGRVKEHQLHIAIGSGGNGKSTLLNGVSRVMGDYATGAPPGLLKKPKGEKHSTDLASLKGVRLAVTSESGESTTLDDEAVKRLTGNDPVTARFCHKDNFTFVPSHHLWLMTNEEPQIGSVGRAMIRRLRLIPFTNEIPLGKEDVHLDEKLRREDSAILAWLLEGYRMYLKEGLASPPEAVQVATQEYMDGQDQLKMFMDERYERTGLENGEVVQFSKLYADYKRYLAVRTDQRDRSSPPLPSKRGFAAKLRGMDYRVQKATGNKTVVAGIRRKLDNDSPSGAPWSRPE